ncbi:hypothetical protein WJX73_006922 [Symbiochloris irregularis]|uniref:Tryptophan synthase beta chain-like PALP domain-containing protein n=1 Tax=Symbiochloris irregularis TaxID=706552 RepID=A0AAW1PMI4_9CHLO
MASATLERPVATSKQDTPESANGARQQSGWKRPVGKLNGPRTQLEWHDGLIEQSSKLRAPDLRNHIASSVTDLVGWTPTVMLNKVTAGLPGRVAVKMECLNPFSSVKDRTALALIEDLERQGKLIPGGENQPLEMTSGNTGIGLAWVAAAKGYKLTCTMPSAYSDERKALLLALGTDLHLTDKLDGPAGMLARASELEEENPHLMMTRQFEAAANVRVHYQQTGPEIWSQSQGRVDFLVATAGTGGTITGAGTFLKEQKPGVEVVAVEPLEGAYWTTGCGGPHPVQGVSPGLDVPTLDRSLFDEVLTAPSAEAMQMCHRLAREEGMFVGPSSGLAIHGAIQLASRPENEGKLVVVIAPSFGERYLSSPPWAQFMEEARKLPTKLLTEEEKPKAMAVMQQFIDKTKPLPPLENIDVNAAAAVASNVADTSPLKSGE